MNYVINHLLPYTTRALTDINDLGKSVALVQSRAAPSTVTRATDFPAVINVG